MSETVCLSVSLFVCRGVLSLFFKNLAENDKCFHRSVAGVGVTTTARSIYYRRRKAYVECKGAA